MRASLICRIQRGEALFPGIIGYEDSVVPHVVKRRAVAFSSAQNIDFSTYEYRRSSCPVCIELTLPNTGLVGSVEDATLP
jgi:hypothetical protein